MAPVDVIIIGSGPAGCAAASVCARAGLGVLIISAPDPVAILDTMDDTPVVPLESVHPGVGSLLDQLGASGVDIQAARARYSGIYANGNYSPLGEDENGAWQGLHIDRRVFDAELLYAVEKQQVIVKSAKAIELIRNNNRISGVVTEHGEIMAPYVIDASGKKGWGGRQLNFKQHFYSPPLLCWTGVSEIDEHFSFDINNAYFISGDRGWTWLAPQPPWYCAWTMLSAKGENDLLPPDMLREYPVISNVNVGNMRWRMYRPLCTEGMLLCGDAAGVLDPAAGQGIFNALWSGIVAGQTVVKCLREPMMEAIHLAQYDDWFASQFEMKVAQLTAYYRENGIQMGYSSLRSE